MRLLRVRVTPRSARDEILRWEDAVLHVRLTAPPVEGAANSACCEFIAHLLAVPKSRVEVVKGHRSRQKTLSVEGFTGIWPWERESGPSPGS